MISAEIISALYYHSGPNQTLIVYFIVGAFEGKENSHLKGTTSKRRRQEVNKELIQYFSRNHICSYLYDVAKIIVM